MNVQKYKKRLLEIEKQIDKRMNADLARGRNASDDNVKDAGDRSVDDVAADDEFTEAELNSTLLQQVQDALRRIDNGTYGICLADNKPIPEKRLAAVPWAAYCAKHQALLEAAGSARNWTL